MNNRSLAFFLIVFRCARQRKMPGRRLDAVHYNAAAFSRLVEPVHFTTRCFIADCPMGSLAADALCGWSEYTTTEGQHEVCLMPTRSLGGGLGAGTIDLETVALAMPRENVVTVRLTVAQLLGALGTSDRAAWERCHTFENSVSWQVSGMQLVRRCGPPEPSRPEFRLQLASRDGTLLDATADGDALVPVVTVQSALSLLPTPAEPAIERSITMQQVFADYLRANSPLNYSEVARQRGYTRWQHDASCYRSACGHGAELDRPIKVVSSRASAEDEFTALHFIGTAALLLALVGGCAIWRRRRARQALASPPVSARTRMQQEQQQVPELQQPVHVHERVPLKTGSSRLTHASQLGT